MKLKGVTYRGPEIDDPGILDAVPAELASLLARLNGFIQLGGGLHVRGACTHPEWHSLRAAWYGEHAFHRFYEVLTPGDIPFGEDCVGDQLVLRDGRVARLQAENGILELLGWPLMEFLERAQRDPVDILQLQPLLQFHREGHRLEPGQLLHAYPPFCTREAEQGVALRAVPARERQDFLVGFAEKAAGAADGTRLEIQVTD